MKNGWQIKTSVSGSAAKKVKKWSSDDMLEMTGGMKIMYPPANIPEVLCEYHDGDHFKNNILFQEHSDALQLFFYFDEFEVANLLGYAKTKHKPGGIYYILGNFPHNKCSALHTIQLAMLVAVPDIK